MGEVIDWRGSAAFHPSVHIQDEMTSRNWTRDRMGAAMAATDASDPGRAKLTLDMYFIIGPTRDTCRLGPVMTAQIAGAFGVSREFIEGLERSWLKARGKEMLEARP